MKKHRMLEHTLYCKYPSSTAGRGGDNILPKAMSSPKSISITLKSQLLILGSR